MKEIEFRGGYMYDNSVYGTNWVYGDYAYGNSLPEIIDGKTGAERTIKPETLGQYIGLKDDCGQKIYEGDVVRVVPTSGVAYQGVVIFNPHVAAFEVFREELEDTIPLNDDFSIQILGNIFDRSEFKEKYWKFWEAHRC